MATGPRHRNRALLRPGPVPDYLIPGEISPDELQKLDDDIYKFLHVRKDQFSRMGVPPSQQFIAEMESRLKSEDPEYALGSYLGLLRQAADLDQTRQTYVTASEKGTFHAFARRLTEGRKEGESFDPDMVKRFRELLDTNHPTTYRGLADIFRLVSRAARLPLIGGISEASTLSITVLLQVVDLSTCFNRRSQANLEFQVGPMDVFLSARTVLFNRSVANPTLSIVKELVLDESGLYHEDLLALLGNVGVFGSELTLLMPDSLSEERFSLRGGTYSAVELVMAAGERLAQGGPVQLAMATLADAIVHKVQQQDGHKDRQIQSILSHFNQMLQVERRSAARINEERQAAGFDYMGAIERAGRLARGMQAARPPGPTDDDDDDSDRPRLRPQSSIRLLEAQREQAVESLADQAPAGQSPPGGAPNVDAAQSEPDSVPEPAQGGTDPITAVLPVADLRAPMPAAAVLGRISSREYESMLEGWDVSLGQIRKQFTSKSPAFKNMVAQLAKVRALDNCLAYGITPGGGRIAGRLGRLMQDEELRLRLGVPEDVAVALEDAFSMAHPDFLSSMESLIGAVYGFRPGLQHIQFRLRDRLPAPKPGPLVASEASGGRPDPGEGLESNLWADGNELDEVVLRLLMGCVLLALEMAGGLSAFPPSPQFGPDGKLRFPDVSGLAPLGDSDPFLAYCALLRAGGAEPGPDDTADPETALMRLIRLNSGDRQAMAAVYRKWIGPNNRPASLSPGLGTTRVREGWSRGFERGFMAEVETVMGEPGGAGAREARVLELLTEMQVDIDAATGTLEGEKMKLARERVIGILR